MEVLVEWADAAAGSGAFDRDAYLTWVKRELSVTLARGNARLFKKFVGVLTRGIGQRLVEGMDVCVSLGSGSGPSQRSSVLFVTAQRASAVVSGLHHGHRGVAPAPRFQLYVRCAGPCCACGGCRAPASGASV